MTHVSNHRDSSDDSDSRSTWHPARHPLAGFSLIEMLVCITILAIVIFPLLLIKEESILDATDAKLSRICRNQIQKLVSQAMVDLEPGDRHDGTLADAGYPGILYEMTCEEIDLSTEIDESSERRTEDGFDTEQFGWENKRSLWDDNAEGDGSSPGEQDGSGFTLLDEDQVEIDPRFKYRHLRITLMYYLGQGEDAEEVKILTETYLPPLPDKENLFDDMGRDLVPPNTGQ